MRCCHLVVDSPGTEGEGLSVQIPAQTGRTYAMARAHRDKRDDGSRGRFDFSPVIHKRDYEQIIDEPDHRLRAEKREHRQVCERVVGTVAAPGDHIDFAGVVVDSESDRLLQVR